MPRVEHEDTGSDLPSGDEQLDRAAVQVTLAAHGAVLWQYRYCSDELTWFCSDPSRLLALPGADAETLRSRLRALLDPVINTARTAAPGQDLESQRSFEDADGLTRWVHMRTRPFGADQPEGLVGVVSDAWPDGTDTRQLAVFAERYRLLVELTPDATCVHQDGVITYVNPAAVRLLRADTDEQLLGRFIGEFIAEPALSALYQRVSGLTEEGMGSEPTEVRLSCLDGSAVLVKSVSVRTTWHDQPAFQVLMHDITEQRRAERALRAQATHDELTGLLNRRGVHELLANLTVTAVEPVGVVFCDIDNFKRINDSLGHEAGDELLVALAQQLVTSLPAECAIGRISGDEFLIVGTDLTALGGMQVVMQRVADTLRTTVPVSDQLVSVSASTGGALLTGSMTGHDVLRHADVAMFDAKSRGPGRMSLADSERVTVVESQLRLEGELRHALATGALALHYQPIVAGDGAIIAVEALLRWPHPRHGLLTAGPILTAAEQGNLVQDLDRWVLRTALTEAVNWPRVGGAQPAVAVNLSNSLLGDSTFLGELHGLLDESGVDPQRVVLEVLETGLVDLTAATESAMHGLVARGVRFALDDFGTGYSSLARLKTLPVHLLKLDRSFVSTIDTVPADRAIAHAIVTMTHALGHACVAEGVETSRQLHTLRELDVDSYQGYFFFRPMSAAELRNHLETRT